MKRTELVLMVTELTAMSTIGEAYWAIVNRVGDEYERELCIRTASTPPDDMEPNSDAYYNWAVNLNMEEPDLDYEQLGIALCECMDCIYLDGDNDDLLVMDLTNMDARYIDAAYWWVAHDGAGTGMIDVTEAA